VLLGESDKGRNNYINNLKCKKRRPSSLRDLGFHYVINLL
jgi:hypothetical protein